jgi:hypothetical protein
MPAIDPIHSIQLCGQAMTTIPDSRMKPGAQQKLRLPHLKNRPNHQDVLSEGGLRVRRAERHSQ